MKTSTRTVQAASTQAAQEAQAVTVVTKATPRASIQIFFDRLDETVEAGRLSPEQLQAISKHALGLVAQAEKIAKDKKVAALPSAEQIARMEVAAKKASDKVEAMKKLAQIA